MAPFLLRSPRDGPIIKTYQTRHIMRDYSLLDLLFPLSLAACFAGFGLAYLF